MNLDTPAHRTLREGLCRWDQSFRSLRSRTQTLTEFKPNRQAGPSCHQNELAACIDVSRLKPPL